MQELEVETTKTDNHISVLHGIMKKQHAAEKKQKEQPEELEEQKTRAVALQTQLSQSSQQHMGSIAATTTTTTGATNDTNGVTPMVWAASHETCRRRYSPLSHRPS